MTVTDEMLIAYADGEADEATRAAVENAIAADPAQRERLAAHRALRARFSSAFAGALADPVPQRLIDAVQAASQVVEPPMRRPTPMWVPVAGMAACLALGLALGGQFAPKGSVGPDLTAQGQLAKALDSQLASADQAGRPVRIGVSFKAEDGRYCRTFQTTGQAGLAGLACRDPNAWRIEVASAQAAATGDFRTAAGAPPAVMQTVDQMMSGEPLDAAAEKAAKVKGWR
ncbi:MAG TPA: hypothetical protein VFN88_12790 [Caulobacteraceae bacterium]|nr:hypothetical protein [Caulobacteraceae bacterium]